jgi:hypothetical protein
MVYALPGEPIMSEEQANVGDVIFDEYSRCKLLEWSLEESKGTRDHIITLTLTYLDDNFDSAPRRTQKQIRLELKH